MVVPIDWFNIPVLGEHLSNQYYSIFLINLNILADPSPLMVKLKI